MTRKLNFIAAIAAAALSITASSILASAATEDEPVDTAQTEQMSSPKWHLRNAQLSPSQTTRLGSLADRCRPVTEYAQLGEFNDEGLNFLRRGCR